MLDLKTSQKFETTNPYKKKLLKLDAHFLFDNKNLSNKMGFPPVLFDETVQQMFQRSTNFQPPKSLLHDSNVKNDNICLKNLMSCFKPIKNRGSVGTGSKGSTKPINY